MVKVPLSLSLFLSLVAAGGWFDSCDNRELSPEGVVSASCQKAHGGKNDAKIDLTQKCFRREEGSGSTIHHGGDGLKGCRNFEIIKEILQVECDVQDGNSTTGVFRTEWNNDLLSNQNGVLDC